MRYRSTRGDTARPGFEEVLLDGLAPDGGLYVPVEWPAVAIPSGWSYPATAAAAIGPYVEGSGVAVRLEQLCAEAYARFRHPEVAPLRDLGEGRFLLELFWGPTFSFKDYALQVLARFFDMVLAARDRRVVVLGATSGDTGSAAIEACRGRQNIDVVILYPEGRISEVQRRQMTTVADRNVTTVAVDGTFDDCQALVKAAFADPRWSGRLAAINSINWGRIAAQTAYYFHACAAVGEAVVDFVVPTGNFGNVFAGHAARRMGAPIGRLVVANNRNHGLAGLIDSGELVVDEVTPTLAPAMDIQIPSNLERYLFELSGGDPATVRRWQHELATAGRLRIEAKRQIGEAFGAGWVDDPRVVETIRRVFETHGIVIDPHTAVAWVVGEDNRRPGVAQVIIATAHPAKFGEAVQQALGRTPEMPPEMAALADLPEQVTPIGNSLPDLVGVLETAAG
jgi:threonine synthase